ncbi:hypothetical protein AMECASPLE_036639 [Ameca splendens]|uniref:Uncharacterized protein n=1 Tax=Ameca splendens TaxID=208324 RepID=A0ABV1AF76_9TELE
MKPLRDVSDLLASQFINWHTEIIKSICKIPPLKHDPTTILASSITTQEIPSNSSPQLNTISPPKAKSTLIPQNSNAITSSYFTRTKKSSGLSSPIFQVLHCLLFIYSLQLSAADQVPSSLKTADIKPLLRQTSDLRYFPTTGPSPTQFLSKVLERAAAVQLQDHLHLHTLFEKFQYGFRHAHSRHSTGESHLYPPHGS